MSSYASQLAALDPVARQEIIGSLSPAQAQMILGDFFGYWARDEQQPPAWPWEVWLLIAGRGAGKTKVGAALTHRWADQVPIQHLVAATAADARDTMVEGPAGILASSPAGKRPRYEPSKRRLTWPNGCVASIFSAEEPDRLRGPQAHKVWADELASWKYPRETWDNLVFGLRLGDLPQAVVTTTPRPIKLLRELVKDPANAVTRASTYANAENLAPAFLRKLLRRYEGTQLARQELHAQLLDEMPGALWKRSMFRVGVAPSPGAFEYLVVAVDPAASNTEESSETGIVIVGGIEDRLWVLEDLSGRYSPDEWGRIVVQASWLWQADEIIGEVNNGGDMVEAVVRNAYDKARDDGAKQPYVPFRKVHASRGKRTRAEPVAQMYEQKRVMHARGFEDLEDQLATWEPGTGMESPDRLDALVWGAWAIAIDPEETENVLVHDAPVHISRY